MTNLARLPQEVLNIIYKWLFINGTYNRLQDGYLVGSLGMDCGCTYETFKLPCSDSNCLTRKSRKITMQQYGLRPGRYAALSQTCTFFKNPRNDLARALLRHGTVLWTNPDELTDEQAQQVTSIRMHQQDDIPALLAKAKNLKTIEVIWVFSLGLRPHVMLNSMLMRPRRVPPTNAKERRPRFEPKELVARDRPSVQIFSWWMLIDETVQPPRALQWNDRGIGRAGRPEVPWETSSAEEEEEERENQLYQKDVWHHRSEGGLSWRSLSKDWEFECLEEASKEEFKTLR